MEEETDNLGWCLPCGKRKNLDQPQAKTKDGKKLASSGLQEMLEGSSCNFIFVRKKHGHCHINFLTTDIGNK